MAGIFVGSLLTLSPLLGLAWGMTGAFRELGNSGVANPQALAADIHQSLLATAAGFVLCPAGMVLIILSIILYVRRKPLAPPPLP